nr:LacI family DNA-binding transcriptional regulator [Anaerotalea alkaliphila]
MATIEDVVKKSKVSRSTVFRFLNGQNVRKSSEVKIMDAMRQLNYKTDEVQKRNNYVIEVSIPSNYNEFQGFSEIVQGIMESAEESGIAVQLCRREGRQIDDDYLKWNREERVGVLVIGKNKADDLKEAAHLVRKNIPHIFVNHVFEMKDVNCIGPDMEQAAYEVIKVLLEKGHQRIMALGKYDEFLVDEQKINGYKRALAEKGIRPEGWLQTYEDAKDWESRIRKALRSREVPDAFFGLCDSDSIKFVNIAREEGYQIPQDISVVGMDDISMAKYAFPPLTTIRIPFKRMGIVAVKQMMYLFQGEFRHLTVEMNYKLVERTSVVDRRQL